MDVIVDTHAAIWFITDHERLPEFSKKVIEEPQNSCLFNYSCLPPVGKLLILI